ncbi:MAG: DNA polymerase III subunit beta, partial [Zetaproteobacteria bacterium CG17_big_fil_post_rev_8_21_14_2_50_50_13]
MRLSEFQGDTIREVFKQCVGEHDELYLFGSRVDNHAKGSDIDLFLQTSLSQ